MTPKLKKYINGSVKICIRGAMPEKFINLCVAEQIYLWGLSKENEDIYAWIELGDFYRIRPLVRRSGTRVTVKAYRGWPFFSKKIWRRKMLVLGAIMCLITIQILASYIWFIDVVGTKATSPLKISAVAQEFGLKPGVLKDTIQSKKIENAILIAIPEVSWVSINFTGTRVVIEVVEKTLPKQDDKAPANIVSDRDVIITEIIALAGQPAVKKGDTVRKGDILIKGVAPVITPTTPDQPAQPVPQTAPAQLVKASGIVKARVWYESYGEAALQQTIKERTGRQEMEVLLHLGGYEMALKRAPQPPFELYESEITHKRLPQWRNSQLFVESTIQVYHELQAFSQEISIEQARDEAKARALQSVQQIIPESAQILARNIEILKLNEPNLVRIKVGVETVEDIGISQMISQ